MKEILRLGWLHAITLVCLVVASGGCQVNPTLLYRTGYDKSLTEQRWANRSPDDAVVIVGGARSVWQRVGDPKYAFEVQERFRIDARHTYDAVLVKAGDYQLETLVGAGGTFADIGGYQGLGASSGTIASFTAGPGEVVYVGDLDAQVFAEGVGTCAASLSTSEMYGAVASAFAKQFPYVGRRPTTRLLRLDQTSIQFPCGRDQ
jgi:hypothetical protein